ncbi:hypothetical protein TorRG33x02_299870 [Trema orientale]|uniref:Uncharacterized protein n=1 Tax=Trema orientale TaxID=63057 RepID=A0A2P5C2U1_TREOI|nr:hypothetical protein TorRG33x02_299870 [Trema orientale]
MRSRFEDINAEEKQQLSFDLDSIEEISGLPTGLKKEPSLTAASASADAMVESSSSSTARLDEADSFRAI